jgi:CO/xanthine dehydrogenase Mo-binding subunit
MTKNPSLLKNPGIDSWISFSMDGLINVRIGKVDIGQKISTAIARIVSEELDLDPKRIMMVMPDTILSPNEGMTSGSNSMEEAGNAIRLAAATIREMLMELAARELNTSVASLEVTDGTISSRETDRITNYWDLQEGRLFNKAINIEAKVKPGNLYGKSQTRYSGADITNIVTGSYKFIQDVNLNSMLHARPVRPPNINSKLDQIDVEVEGYLKKKGITLIRNGSFLAVAGMDEYEVIKAANTVKKVSRLEAIT